MSEIDHSSICVCHKIGKEHILPDTIYYGSSHELLKIIEYAFTVPRELIKNTTQIHLLHLMSRETIELELIDTTHKRIVSHSLTYGKLAALYCKKIDNSTLFSV